MPCQARSKRSRSSGSVRGSANRGARTPATPAQISSLRDPACSGGDVVADRVVAGARVSRARELVPARDLDRVLVRGRRRDGRAGPGVGQLGDVGARPRRRVDGARGVDAAGPDHVARAGARAPARDVAEAAARRAAAGPPASGGTRAGRGRCPSAASAAAPRAWPRARRAARPRRRRRRARARRRAHQAVVGLRPGREQVRMRSGPACARGTPGGRSGACRRCRRRRPWGTGTSRRRRRSTR